MRFIAVVGLFLAGPAFAGADLARTPAVFLAGVQTFLRADAGAGLMQTQPEIRAFLDLRVDSPFHLEVAEILSLEMGGSSPASAEDLAQAYRRAAAAIEKRVDAEARRAARDFSQGALEEEQLQGQAALLRPFSRSGSAAGFVRRLEGIAGAANASLALDRAKRMASALAAGMPEEDVATLAAPAEDWPRKMRELAPEFPERNLKPAWDDLLHDLDSSRVSAPALTLLPGSMKWFEQQEARIWSRMPTLWRILNDPGKMKKFLTALSLLRLAAPYGALKYASDPPLALAQKLGMEFRLNELHVVPGSESFRRHIIYARDDQGIFAVELKMPGEEASRHYIFQQHFDIAAELWQKFPEDPGVVKPVYYAQFKGPIELYGQKRLYDSGKPLGVVLFEYADGKRFTNSPMYLSAKSRQKASVDAVVAAIRLHRLSYAGKDASNTDMHPENLRVLQDGRGVLVGDFGAFAKAKLNLLQRREETREILYYYDDVSRRFMARELRAIYPEVARRLAKDARGLWQAYRFRRQAKEELGLTLRARINENPSATGTAIGMAWIMSWPIIFIFGIGTGHPIPGFVIWSIGCMVGMVGMAFLRESP